MTDSQLRYSIMKIATGKHKWSYDEFHDLMDDWGYGRSLKKLSIKRLYTLRDELLGIKTDNVPEEFKLDAQGKQMYAIMKKAGWTMKMVNMHCLKRFKKIHWLVLTPRERRGVIGMLRNYCK